MRRLGLLFMLAATAALAGEWTGVISETNCGAKHGDASDKSVACVKRCIKGGAKPVLVTDGKVVNITNTDKVPEELYGQKVDVTGELKDGVLTLDTISAAK